MQERNRWNHKISRTLYNYVDKCLLTAHNLDMPRKVR